MRQGGRTQSRSDQRTHPPGAVQPDVVLFAVALTYTATGIAAMADVAGGQPLYTLFFQGFMHVGLGVAVLLGGLWMRRSELPQATWWSVVGGYVAGIVFISALLVWANLSALFEGGLAAITTLWDDFVFFGNLGGLFGFVAGVSRARSRYNRHLRKDLEASNELVESADEALWMFRADWSEVLYLNSAYEEIYGQSIDELEADPTAVLEAVHPDDRPEAQAAMEELAAGRSADLEIRVNAEEGFGRWVWIEAQPVYRNGEQYAIAGFSRDVTERKRRQRRFEAIFNQTFQFTGLMEPDGTLIEANNAALEFGGIDREDVIGREVWEAYWFRISEETQRRAKADVERAADGEFVRHELEVQGDDDTAIIDFSIRPVTDEDGDVTLLVPEGRNITDQKRYEERVVALHETTRRLFRAETKTEAADIATAAARNLLGLPVNSILLYAADENVLTPVASTEEAEALFGDIPPMKPGDSLAWESYTSGEARTYDDVSTVEGRQNDETQMRSELILPVGDHGVFIAGSTVPGEFDEQVESLAKLLATNLEAAFDGIERQRDLEERQAELRRQNERLDEFASVVSHDLRNPLTVAKGRLELVEMADEEENADEHVAAATDALDRMGALIEDLLELARAGETVDELEPVSLADHAERCWQNVETDGATLTVDDDATVLADESRFAQLLENLFRNSIDHSDAGVTVRLGTLDEGFYVADDGAGIPLGDRESVFEAGYTTADDGTGFGLSIVQKIAESQGWTVAITESEDGGARFEFTGVERPPEAERAASETA
jgi:PAS domain S-box-containing protein